MFLELLAGVCALLCLLTLRVRDRLRFTNAGYGLLMFGLINAALAQRHAGISAYAVLATIFTAAGAMLLTYGAFFRKEIRNFRESLLPK